MAAASSPLAAAPQRCSSPFASICVYCGSSTGTKPDFLQAANALGALHGVAVHPPRVRRRERRSDGRGVVGARGRWVRPGRDPHRARARGGVRRVRRGDGGAACSASRHGGASGAFVAMPGGFGTLEELLEMITWQQLGYRKKPVGVLNVGGYFDLFEFLDRSVECGFVRPERAPSWSSARRRTSCWRSWRSTPRRRRSSRASRRRTDGLRVEMKNRDEMMIMRGTSEDTSRVR